LGLGLMGFVGLGLVGLVVVGLVGLGDGCPPAGWGSA
jgi:hypothetical protein